MLTVCWSPGNEGTVLGDTSKWVGGGVLQGLVGGGGLTGSCPFICTLHFILGEMRIHWRILSRGIM